MITAKSLEALYRQAPKREKLATQKLPRIRTPATPLTTVVGCQPLFRDRWSRAGATASVERPDSFTDAEHGVCRRHPACLVTTCLMEAHAYPCSSKSDCAYKGCADRPCTSSSSYCNNGVWDYICVSALEYFFYCLHAQLARMITCSCCTLYGLSLTAPRSDVGMCSV